MIEDCRGRCNEYHTPDRSGKNELLRPVESFTEIKVRLHSAAGSSMRFDYSALHVTQKHLIILDTKCTSTRKTISKSICLMHVLAPFVRYR